MSHKLPKADREVARVWAEQTGFESSRKLRAHCSDCPDFWPGGVVPQSEVFRRWWTGENLPDLPNFLALVDALDLTGFVVVDFGRAIAEARAVKMASPEPARGKNLAALRAYSKMREPSAADGIFPDELVGVVRGLEAKGWIESTGVGKSWRVTPEGLAAVEAWG